jgi:tRNA modification GTPase
MYNLNETVVAVSSPSLGARSIVRITGPRTRDIVREIFNFSAAADKPGIQTGSVTIDPELSIGAILYLFLAPHSYTGEDVAEIHIDANQTVAEGLMETLLCRSKTPLRSAGPGEFTARAYLNGKIDLAQAEAVNEIITCSNRFQLAAAEKLLAGRLAQATEEILAALMECLSLIEAGLDFSMEDIEFIGRPEAVERITKIKQQLEKLLAGNISYESLIDLPAVGIAGVPNAGKSSLLNTLLGRKRSIVSGQRKTTRDILTGLLALTNCKCVIFDCAGLTTEPENILDELAHQAAVEALEKASAVAFCVDISKTDFSEDVAIRKFIKDEARVIPVATKLDLLSEDTLAERLAELNKLFAAEFLPTSAVTGSGLEQLRDTIDKKLIELALDGGRDGHAEIVSGIALITRHRQAVTEAINNISESIKEIKVGNDEVAAMLSRAAYQNLSDIQQQSIDEQILEGIFSRFCIGK